MHTLLLRDRPARAGGTLADLTPLVSEWSRTARAVGGYWAGRMRFKDIARDQLIDGFDAWLGCRVTEYHDGVVAWDGYINRLDLMLNGVNYTRTLDTAWWHNYVNIYYTTTYGERDTTGWDEDTDSTDQWGRMEYLLSGGMMNSTGADGLAARHLEEFAWPRTRMTGGLSFERQQLMRSRSGDVLSAELLGFWHTLNWRYNKSNRENGAATLVNAACSAAEFVTAKRLETNAMNVQLNAQPTPQRWGNAVSDIVSQGDASGNVWQAGVYDDYGLVYEQAPEEPDYILQNGMLTHKGAGLAKPALVRPGKLLYNVSAPLHQTPPNATYWDDPAVAYIEEVRYNLDGTLELKLYDMEESIAVVKSQLDAKSRRGYG